jgi:hypothetical protein
MITLAPDCKIITLAPDYHFDPGDNITVAPDDNIASQMITFNPR